MEPVLLMFDAVGFVLVLLWAARGNGGEGLFAWRGEPSPRSKPRRD